jgi:hypothetical protein
LQSGLDLDEPEQQKHAEEGWQVFEDEVAPIAKGVVIPESVAVIAVRVDGGEDESDEHEKAQEDVDAEPERAEDRGEEMKRRVRLSVCYEDVFLPPRRRRRVLVSILLGWIPCVVRLRSGHRCWCISKRRR